MHPSTLEGTAKVVRCLGVHVKAHGFAFVTTENMTALDSGVRLCNHPDFADCLGNRFSRLLRTFQPDAVVLSSAKSDANATKRHMIIAAIKRRSRQNGTKSLAIGNSAIRRYFSRRNANTKYEIALEVARILPELAWKLPPCRKPWQSERYSMSIFDAAAALIVYFAGWTFGSRRNSPAARTYEPHLTPPEKGLK